MNTVKIQSISNNPYAKAFVESVANALKEIPEGTGIYDVAQAVADRIIGR